MIAPESSSASDELRHDRKERTLRFPSTGLHRTRRFASISALFAAKRHRAVRAAAGAVAAVLTLGALGIMTGCDGITGRQLDPNRGWVDPSELVAARHGPLRVPILNQLTPGIEEPNEVYAGATEPKPEDLIPPQGDYPIG